MTEVARVWTLTTIKVSDPIPEMRESVLVVEAAPVIEVLGELVRLKDESDLRKSRRVEDNHADKMAKGRAWVAARTLLETLRPGP